MVVWLTVVGTIIFLMLIHKIYTARRDNFEKNKSEILKPQIDGSNVLDRAIALGKIHNSMFCTTGNGAPGYNEDTQTFFKFFTIYKESIYLVYRDNEKRVISFKRFEVEKNNDFEVDHCERGVFVLWKSDEYKIKNSRTFLNSVLRIKGVKQMRGIDKKKIKRIEFFKIINEIDKEFFEAMYHSKYKLMRFNIRISFDE